MRLVHSLRKAFLASALIKHQRVGTASHFARCVRPAPPHRQAGLSLRTNACLAPLRGAPVSLPADAVASMGRSKAKPDNQGKSNTSCYIQVCTLSFLRSRRNCFHVAAAMGCRARCYSSGAVTCGHATHEHHVTPGISTG